MPIKPQPWKSPGSYITKVLYGDCLEWPISYHVARWKDAGYYGSMNRREYCECLFKDMPKFKAMASSNMYLKDLPWERIVKEVEDGTKDWGTLAMHELQELAMKEFMSWPTALEYATLDMSPTYIDVITNRTKLGYESAPGAWLIDMMYTGCLVRLVRQMPKSEICLKVLSNECYGKNAV